MGTLFEVSHATGAVDFKQKGTSNLVLEKGTAFPGTPVNGQAFYRTDLQQLYIYDSGLADWKTQAGGSLRIYNEVPTGTIDGVNTVFTTANAYVAGTTVVTRNGLVLEPNGVDYTETTPSTGTITFVTAPSSGATVLISYSRTIGQDVPKLLKFSVVTGTPSGTYTGSTTVFNLPFTYTLGSGSLLVYSAGVLMLVGASNDYQETNTSTVTFNSARTTSEVIQFVKLGVANDYGNTGGWVEGVGEIHVETLTNQVRIGDGSVTLPALAFNSHTNTGFYQSAANQIALASNGFSVWTADSSSGLVPTSDAIYNLGSSTLGWSRLYIGNGTVGSPSLTFSNDSSTGLYHVSSGKIAYSSSGTSILSLDSNGLTMNSGKVFSNYFYAGDQASSITGLGGYVFDAEDNTTTGTYLRVRSTANSGDANLVVGMTATSATTSTGKFSHGGVDVLESDQSGTNITFKLNVYNGTSQLSVMQGNTVQQALFANGSASAPSVSFFNDTGTGMYRSAANELSFTINSTQQAWFNALGFNIVPVVRVTDGSATTPGIQFSNDASTGIYRPTTSQLSITAGGTEIARFQKGTSNVLELRSGTAIQNTDGTSAAPAYSFSANTNTGIYRPAANSIGFILGSTSAEWRMSSAGLRPPTIDGGTTFGGFGESRSLALGTTTDITPDIDASGFIEVRTFNNVNTASNVALYFWWSSATDAGISTIVAPTGSGGPSINSVTIVSSRTLRFNIGAFSGGSAYAFFVRLHSG